MSREIIILSPNTRAKAHLGVERAPDGWTLELREPKRTDAQNRLMWDCLNACSRQKTYHGLSLTPEDWKHLFTAGVRRELRLVPNMAGDGFVQLGVSTSRMTKPEMTELIEFMLAWCAENNVRLPIDEVAA